MAADIIGRREELLALEAFLEAVPAGGQALLLEGDAGIGKSALWSEGLRLARERSFRVLTARAARSETQVAFATVGDRPVEAPLELDRASAASRRLAVEPLSVGAIHRLLWGRLALNLPRPELVRVHEIAGGNPFFALELGRAIARGAIRVDSRIVTLPESLSALVTEREERPERVAVTDRGVLVQVAVVLGIGAAHHQLAVGHCHSGVPNRGLVR